MAAYTEDAVASNQRQPLAEKLFGLLKRVEGDGRELARSTEGLADKLSGTIPSTESNESLSRSRDNVHDLIDLINDRLTGLFADMRGNLERAHRAVGSLGRPDEVKSPAMGMIEKASRY